ncbi:large conductance mechanosensitive channel protein MscL [Falsirhodobacter xinxiangensis]|uniref:large conductance mechanosensitive channel protein MscL n=1 Tax=Falsirhodobacter xinxiangensis TaxID=2530049 RepID=UPI0010AA07C2|nr:large conductance mechanosensitive channel protein MscL [Rhodobacter xinxiangensis]
MLQEFKTFIARGNVLDLAVGIIIGAAFTAIVNSMVQDLINPVIGLIIGGIDFTNLYWVMSGNVPEGVGLQTAKDSGAAVFAYGSFIMACFNFFIIAFVVFLLVKAVNKVKDTAIRKEELEAPAKGPTQEELLAQIRDLLAAKPTL